MNVFVCVCVQSQRRIRVVLEHVTSELLQAQPDDPLEFMIEVLQRGQVDIMCCSVLQCVAVCCSVLQCVAVCCSVLQCVAVCCSVLQCVAR